MKNDPVILALGASTPYLIRQTSRLFMRALERRITRHGITIGMWFFLRVLWEEDDLKQAELSERVGVVGPTTVSAVERLEKQGLIERRKSETDRRLSHIKLTPAGRAIEKEIGHYAQEVADLGLAPLSREETALLHTWLLRIYEALRQEEGA